MYLLLHYYLKHKNTAVILRKSALLAQNVKSKRCNCCLIVHRWVNCTFAISWMLQTVRWWKFRTLTVCSRTRRSCTSRKITSQPSWISAGVCDGESQHSFLLTNSWINHLCFCFVFLKSSLIENTFFNFKGKYLLPQSIVGFKIALNSTAVPVSSHLLLQVDLKLWFMNFKEQTEHDFSTGHFDRRYLNMLDFNRFSGNSSTYQKTETLLLTCNSKVMQFLFWVDQ